MDWARRRAGVPAGGRDAIPTRPPTARPRLTADATRILDAAIIQTYTPNNFSWESLAEPDMSNGWASA